jgi:hypothetical protein
LKKVFAQVVIAMAHHGYLELEGGQQMIEFIVTKIILKICTFSIKNHDLKEKNNRLI